MDKSTHCSSKHFIYQETAYDKQNEDGGAVCGLLLCKEIVYKPFQSTDYKQSPNASLALYKDYIECAW